jgi:hypothetical protein
LLWTGRLTSALLSIQANPPAKMPTAMHNDLLIMMKKEAPNAIVRKSSAVESFSPQLSLPK